MTITRITGRAVPLFLDDIDTDRIIPARFLRCVTFDGLGEHAFEDDRQQDPAHPFNQPQFQGANILIAGRNFGCGSSREHAPQSLLRWGIKAVVAESFAEIFFGNCTALGIPAVCGSREQLARLAERIQSQPAAEVTVDLSAKRVACGDLQIACEMPEGARQALVTGAWDFLGQLLQNRTQIARTAGKLPYLKQFAV